ncbi:PrgI family protein [Streptomyces sp. NPDC003077]|uniref:PrgI family protein n=1 Tax=Streptomyces sp. NPDC003077 TaxID=3154443 RepID=UPI0033A388B4
MTPDRAEDGDALCSAHIPADIDRPDRVLGPLTARQTALLAGTAGVLLLGYYATHPFLAPLAYMALVTPIASVMIALALGHRDGISLDRFALAALAHWRSPNRRLQAPEGIPALPDAVPTGLAGAGGPTPGVLDMPCEEVLDSGILALGRDGYAALATCSPVNFDLRSGAEQQALTGAFARWLNSLTGPTQILIRARRLDPAPLVDQLAQTAPDLPHPALERAALDHAAFLQELAVHSDLLTRQTLIAAREPAKSPAPRHRTGTGPARARHRIAEADRALAPADIQTIALTRDQAVTALTDPDPRGFLAQATADHTEGEG